MSQEGSVICMVTMVSTGSPKTKLSSPMVLAKPQVRHGHHPVPACNNDSLWSLPCYTDGADDAW